MNYTFSFHTKNVFDYFHGIVAQFKFIKQKFPN